MNPPYNSHLFCFCVVKKRKIFEILLIVSKRGLYWLMLLNIFSCAKMTLSSFSRSP